MAEEMIELMTWDTLKFTGNKKAISTSGCKCGCSCECPSHDFGNNAPTNFRNEFGPEGYDVVTDITGVAITD